MGSKPKPAQKAVAGNYIAIPYALYDSPAYRALSARAKDVVNAIARSFTGFNNGRIAVSRDQIAHRTGSQNHTANRAAIAEAANAGVISIERTHPRGSRLSTEYRLCYYETGQHPDKLPASQEYLSCAPNGRKQTRPGNFSRQATTHEEPVSGAATTHDGKLSCAAIAPLEPINGHSSCVTAAQHIEYQRAADAVEAGLSDENSGRHFRGEIEKPRSVTEDRWILAGKAAAANPAGPDPDELRQRVADYIEKHGRGSQTRLAQQAGILGGSLSKFIKGDVDLTNRHRVMLACAMLKAAAAEEKLKPRAAMESRP